MRIIIPILTLLYAITLPVMAQDFAPDYQPRIAVIDAAFIERQSLAFQDLRTQIEQRRKILQQSIQQNEQAIRQQGESLEQQKSTISEQTYSERRQTIESDIRAIKQQLQLSKKQLDFAYNDGVKQIKNAMRQTIIDVSNAYKLDLVLNVTHQTPSIIYHTKRMNISNEILTKLNALLPDIVIKDTEQATLPIRGDTITNNQ